LEILLLLAGFGCLVWFGYDYASTWAAGQYAEYELRQRIAGIEPNTVGFLADRFGLQQPRSAPSRSREAPSDPPAVSQEPRSGNTGESAKQGKVQPVPEPESDLAAARRLKRGSLIGRIEVPRLGLAAPVRSGVDESTLKRAAGHVPYTPLPGQDGNVGIAAHRDKHFRKLRNVKVGDEIRFKTSYGEFTYRVDDLSVVMPENVEVLDPTEDRNLTLVTCYPFNYVGSAPKRFIVRARQVAPAGSTTSAARAKSASPAGS
jgi:LPXTG-site transpeptidase (sortase) family protein